MLASLKHHQDILHMLDRNCTNIDHIDLYRGLGWGEEKGREGKGREGKGREGKGREGKGEEKITSVTQHLYINHLITLCVIDVRCVASIEPSLVPSPFSRGGGEKGLVSTVCACTRYVREFAMNIISDVQTWAETKRDALCLANTFCPVFLVLVVHQEN